MGSNISSISSGLGLVNTLTGGSIPFLGAAGQVVNAVQTFQNTQDSQKQSGQSAATQDLALQQLQERQALEAGQAADDAALERQSIALDAAQDEEDRRNALRRAVARQKAQFGSQGVGSTAGSSEAVLLGLFEESDAEREKREELDALRYAAIDSDLAQSNSLNLLQATQLAERSSLSQYYS